MIKIKIRLMTINDVKDFVTAANYCPADIDLISGRYTVDAKSLMGIFSIVPAECLDCQIYTDSCDEFLDSIKQFIIE
ncbi:MAG: HPr family phosphocarrier protein [Clostridiales bacterium]|nr:HPr family phosphocarrier protein [Clostridiales bacterium]MBR6484211.1 HPr family phosphocarrier protein [Clostridiales bacterium]